MDEMPTFVKWDRICKHYGDLLDQAILADLPGVRVYV